MASGKVKPWQTLWGNWEEEGSPYAMHSMKLQPRGHLGQLCIGSLADSPPAMWFIAFPLQDL